MADCDDKFDELNCAVVIIDKDLYQKNRPPGIKETLQTNVDIAFEIVSIDYFDEIEMTFSIKFKVELKWFVQLKLNTDFLICCYYILINKSLNKFLGLTGD